MLVMADTQEPGGGLTSEIKRQSFTAVVSELMWEQFKVL